MKRFSLVCVMFTDTIMCDYDTDVAFLNSLVEQLKIFSIPGEVGDPAEGSGGVTGREPWMGVASEDMAAGSRGCSH